MNSEVISREMIKPSQATPTHLRYHKLSGIDHSEAPILMPTIFFYSSNDTVLGPNSTRKTNLSEKGCSHHISWHMSAYLVNVRLKQLRDSLEKALALFYPLAGRIQDANFIHCNDEGVPFVVANIGCRIADVAKKVQVTELDKLVSSKPVGGTKLLLAIQVNVFACGGLAIGVFISHKISDAFSLLMFMNTWAAIASGAHIGATQSSLVFNMANIFPPPRKTGPEPNYVTVRDKDLIAKWFTFDAMKLGSLRDKYSKGNYAPSRSMILSAVIWSRLVGCTRAKDVRNLVFYPVNIRPKVGDPRSTMHYFGNGVVSAIARPATDSRDLIVEFVKRTRESIDKIDVVFLQKLQQGEPNFTFSIAQLERDGKEETMSFCFSSLCRFPVYEANFGWGKPVWVSFPTFVSKNTVILMPSSSSEDIEAFINLRNEDMTELENDEKFLLLVKQDISRSKSFSARL